MWSVGPVVTPEDYGSDYESGRIGTRRCESETSRTSRCIDPVAPAVDHNMMVKPTESGQIVGIGGSALRPRLFVMWLQPIATGATFGGTRSITMKDETLQPGRNHSLPSPDREWLSVGRLDELKTPAASDLVQDLRSNRCTGFHMRTIGVDKDCDERCGAVAARVRVALVDKSHRFAISESRPLSVWKFTDEVGLLSENLVDHGTAVPIKSTPNIPLRLVEIGLHGQMLVLVCFIVVDSLETSQSGGNTSDSLDVEPVQRVMSSGLGDSRCGFDPVIC